MQTGLRVDIEPSMLDNVSRFLTNHDMALLAGAGISVFTGIVSAPAVLIVGGLVVKTAG